MNMYVREQMYLLFILAHVQLKFVYAIYSTICSNRSLLLYVKLLNALKLSEGEGGQASSSTIDMSTTIINASYVHLLNHVPKVKCTLLQSSVLEVEKKSRLPLPPIPLIASLLKIFFFLPKESSYMFKENLVGRGLKTRYFHHLYF